MKFCDPNEKNFSSSPGLTPQKRDSYARRYVRVMHNFFEIFKSPSKSAKKVLKSIDFRTFWSEWNYRIQRSQNYKNDIRVVINQHFHQY